MESTDSSQIGPAYPQLPPGFRFHPTDEELIVHYLGRKASSSPLPVSIIAEVDLYKFDPWELPSKAVFGEQEWYFFSPRDRKYPNGARPNRAATSGYWKATGTDKPILATTTSHTGNSGRSHKVGVKKALVFYGGKPPRGVKTDWIMHEYRLVDGNNNTGSAAATAATGSNVTNKAPPRPEFGSKKPGSLRLDDWVLCRIYKKNNTVQRPAFDHDQRILDGSISTTTYHHQHQHQHQHPSSFLTRTLPSAAAATSTMPFFDNPSSIFGSHSLNLNPGDHQFNLLSLPQASCTATTTVTNKRPLLMSNSNNYCWEVDDDQDELHHHTNKRFHQSDHQQDDPTSGARSMDTTADGNSSGGAGGGGDPSFVSMLNQLPPQSTPYAAAASTLLGSLNGPFQLSNATWNS